MNLNGVFEFVKVRSLMVFFQMCPKTSDPASLIRHLIRDTPTEVQILFNQILQGEAVDYANAAHAARKIGVAFGKAQGGSDLATALRQFQQKCPGC